MDTKIDNGEILKQKRIDISQNETIFTLLKKTKSLGGDIMVEAIEELFNDEIKPIQNLAADDNYYTWPTLKQLYLFRKNGRKLI